MSLPQESLLTALRLCASAPAAALELLQEPLWTARQQLCQALATTLASGDWLALLPILNHEQAAVRLHWLASLLVDAQKRQQGSYPGGVTLTSGRCWSSWRTACPLPGCRRLPMTSVPAESNCSTLSVSTANCCLPSACCAGNITCNPGRVTRLPPLSETLCFSRLPLPS